MVATRQNSVLQPNMICHFDRCHSQRQGEEAFHFIVTLIVNHSDLK